MSYVVELRTVTKQGTLDKPLPNKRAVELLDDNDDVGSLKFDYLVGGKHASLLDKGLDEYVEIAVLLDGKEIDGSSRFTIQDWTTETVADGRTYRTWIATSYLDRLDEALVLAEKDQHLREDVMTDAEHRELIEAREEYMEQAIREAIMDAKQRAKEHNDAVRDRRNKSEKGGQAPDRDGDNDDERMNRWGRKAVNWAYGQITNPSQSWYRMCQSFVRQSFGLPGIYDTADEAWWAGLKRGNTPINDIPAGVPVYWGPNHVALSVGDGLCISSDVVTAGQVDEVPIASLHNGAIWGLDWRGWSPECSGRRIYP